jgi:putative ABC transport system substrate-binding protein
MRESCKYGSVRGAGSNPRPYRNRRTFIAGLGSAAGWPITAWAQQQGERVRRIGLLHAYDNRIRTLAQELVGLQPDVIVTGGGAPTAALQRETQTIPIVFMTLADPVASGRLDRPRGNITGFTLFEASMGGKWLELLSKIAPGLKRAGIMFNPDFPAASTYMSSLKTVAQSLKVLPVNTPVHSDVEIETAISALGREPGGGLVVIQDQFTETHRVPIILAAAQNNIPAVYSYSPTIKDGGLLSYGVDQVDTWRRAATYGHLEKLISVPIAEPASVNVYESEQEQSRIIWRQFCGTRSVSAIFRGALMSIAFCAARSQAISRCSFRQNSRWS